MLKKSALLFGLWVLFFTAYAQKNQYTFSYAINRYFSDYELDTMFENAVHETFKENGVRDEVFEQRYKTLKPKIYFIVKSDVEEQLKEELYRWKKRDVAKAPKKSVEYAEIKESIGLAIHTGTKMAILNNPKYAVMLNSDESDHIQNFHSDITVNKDGSLSVVETIRVFNSLGQNINYTDDGGKYTVVNNEDIIKRGIVRYIPEKYDAGKGLNYDEMVSIDKVTRNGNDETYKRDHIEGSRVLFIGNPEKELEAGVHTYKIYYTVQFAITYGDNSDELYWNVNGNGWAMGMDSVSCTLHLPQGAKPISNACYTGVEGSKAQNCYNKTNFDDNTITFAATNALPAKQGLTFSTSWPVGYIHRSSGWFIMLLSNPGPFLVLIVGFYLLLRNGLLKLYYNYSDKKKKSNIIPEFEPPEGINPAYAGFIDNMGHSPSHTTASLINLAVHKYLKINVVGTGKNLAYEISREENMPNEVDPDLFVAEGMMLDGSVLFAQNPSEAMAYFDDVVELYCIKKYKAAPLFIEKTGWQKRGKLYAWVGTVLSSVFMFIHYQPNLYTFAYFFGGIVLCLLANRLLNVSRMVHTSYGRAIMNKLEGFKMFLKTADAQRLDMSNRADANLTLEKYLPYAIALGCDMDWVDKFNDASESSLQLEGNVGQNRIPSYYMPAAGVTAATLFYDNIRRSHNLDYTDYVIRRRQELREDYSNSSRSNSEVYKEALNKITIERPKTTTASKNIWDSIKTTTDSFTTKSSKPSSGTTYKSTPKSSPPPPSPSKGGGHSGGGSGGGGGGGW
jgi:hypothetical protein